MEIGKALAEKMGMKAVPVTNPWETIIQGLQAKKYDAIIGSMTVTDERKKSVSFTNTYYQSGAQIFVAENKQEIIQEGVKQSKYKIEVAPRSKDIVRKFAKFDDEGNITDTINYFYSKESGVIEVFTNNLTYGCGSSLDKDLLNAVLVNFMELENEME